MKADINEHAVCVTDLLTRLALWYSLFTIVLRCPSSPADLNEKSPRICSPYLSSKSFAVPYVQPYYDAYLAPHVVAVKPYTDRLNNQILSPATTMLKTSYDTHAAPMVSQAQKFTEDQWHASVSPRLQLAQSNLKGRYDSNIAPAVNKVHAVVLPYYRSAEYTLTDAYQSNIRVKYNSMLPYAHAAYAQGHSFVFDTALPFAESAVDGSLSFLGRTIWPHLKILYGENVEPQLMRISQRLTRYRESKKIEAAVDSVKR